MSRLMLVSVVMVMIVVMHIAPGRTTGDGRRRA